MADIKCILKLVGVVNTIMLRCAHAQRRHTVVTLYVCVVCVCLFQAYLLFPWTLGKGEYFYGYFTVFSNFVICR